jgi:hypothetical protein
MRVKTLSSLVAVFFATASFAGAAHALPIYWNVFNIEGESAIGADIVTYSSLADMLSDSNRTSSNTLSDFGRNVVGSGSDGSTYWNVFNIEGESAIGADLITYSSLADMLSDLNRTSTNTLSDFGRNVVGSGASLFQQPVAVPEPSALALLLVGILSLAILPWRKEAAAV